MVEVRGFSSSTKADIFAFCSCCYSTLSHATAAWHTSYKAQWQNGPNNLKTKMLSSGNRKEIPKRTLKKQRVRVWAGMGIFNYVLEYAVYSLSAVDSGSKGQNRDNPSNRQSAQSEQEKKKRLWKGSYLIWVWTPASCKQILICSICHNSHWDKWNLSLWHCTRKYLHFYLRTLILKPFLR